MSRLIGERVDCTESTFEYLICITHYVSHFLRRSRGVKNEMIKYECKICAIQTLPTKQLLKNAKKMYQKFATKEGPILVGCRMK